MKIALFLPDLGGGGAQKMMLNLGHEFARRGHDVTLLVARVDGPYKLPENSRLTLVDLGRSRTITASLPLAARLRRDRPDVVVSALFHANVTAALAVFLSGNKRPRLVVTERNHFSERVRNSDRLSDRLYPFLLRLFYRLADKVVGISDGVVEDVRRVARIPEGQTQRIYNPVVTEDFAVLAKENIADPWLDDPAIPVVITSGRLVDQKDYPTLLRGGRLPCCESAGACALLFSVKVRFRRSWRRCASPLTSLKTSGSVGSSKIRLPSSARRPFLRWPRVGKGFAT